jgi:hypothetical protein
VKIDWTYQLTEQLDWHWRSQLRRRYEGLTDAEYFWEAVANCWNVHPRGQGRAPIEAGGGEFVMDFAYPEPSPAPVTTIVWRLAHLIVGVFGTRVASHLAGRPSTTRHSITPAQRRRRCSNSTTPTPVGWPA